MKADLILHNARIYTVDSTNLWAEAVACAGGKILAVGTDSEILALAGPETTSLDMGGKLILPGLTDAHVHFLQYAERQQQVDLFGVHDFERVRERIAQGVEQAKPGEWVLGWGWDEGFWNVAPTRQQLDALAPQNPVALARMDMHTWWVNSEALRRGNVTAETPDPIESQIERDETGEPTGLLREWNAIALVEQQIPEADFLTRKTWLLEAIKQAHRLGLTGIHDQRVEREGRESFKLWQELYREDALALRVHMNLAADFLPHIETLGLRPGFGNDRLWTGHLKTFADGTLGSRTAWMLAPFENEPSNLGIVVTPMEELTEIAAQADAAGFPLSVHAIGDRAVREVITVLSEFRSGRSASVYGIPHRIEHVQTLHPDDLSRLNAHGIAVAAQPVHLMTDWPTADRYWGERNRYTYAFRSLLDHQTLLAFSSDAPVAPLNPMLGIYAAVTRQDENGQPVDGWYPVERVSVAEAIEAYTMSPARIAGKATVQGSITPGKWADLIVLAHNLFEIAPETIKDVAVEMTIFDGQVVYERG